MKKILLLCILLSHFFQAYTQEYLQRSYTANQFMAHTLMWDVVKDQEGRLYFANNDGVLRFDGNNWFTFKTPYPVRSLAFGENGHLYIACKSDFGLIRFTPEGAYEFVSIKKQLDPEKQKTGGFEKVMVAGKVVYFYTDRYIVQVREEVGKFDTKVYDTGNLSGAFVSKNKLYVNTLKSGLGIFENGKVKIILGGEQLKGNPIAAVAIGPKESIVAGVNGGTYLLNSDKVTPLTGAFSDFSSKGLASLALLPDQRIVAGSLHDGVKIFDQTGNRVETLTLPSKEIYSVFSDPEGNIWTAHSKGLTHTLLNIPARVFSPIDFPGYTTDLQILDEHLYISTTSGLYRALSKDGSGFEQVQGINSECWDLQLFQNKLYIASNDGLFEWTNGQLKNLIPGETILHLQEGNVSHQLYALGENGAWKMNATGNGLSQVKEIPPFTNSVWEEENGIQLIGTYYEGLKPLSKNAPKPPEELSEGETIIRMFENRAVFQKGDQIFSLENNGTTWKKEEAAIPLFANARNKTFQFDDPFVVFTQNGIRVHKNNNILSQSVAYCLNGKPHAVFVKGDQYWIAYEDKIFILTDVFKERAVPKLGFSKVSYGKGQNIHSGFFVSESGMIQSTQEWIPGIAFEETPLRIEFGVHSFINPAQNLYSYKIEGLHPAWSNWQKESFVELDGIKGGSYTIWVKGKNAFGTETEEVSFKFYIKVPWYLSGIAYLLYLIGLMALVYLIVWMNQRRLVSKNKNLEEKVSERTKELIAEKAKSDELLLNILPAEVADELKRTGGLEAKQFEEVSVLFTDFVGFTSISEKLSPKELVEEIHYCFKTFDDIMGQNKLEKIKTIGDAYMAVCGMPIKDSSHAVKAVQAALDIQTFIQNYQRERKEMDKPYFEIRIGINSGSVIAGIVGVKKYAYDIWGDTVNMAARMEQNCDPGNINISGSTYELVKNHFKCSYRGKIEAKNKGKIDMYYVTAKL